MTTKLPAQFCNSLKPRLKMLCQSMPAVGQPVQYEYELFWPETLKHESFVRITVPAMNRTFQGCDNVLIKAWKAMGQFAAELVGGTYDEKQCRWTQLSVAVRDDKMPNYS